MTQIELKKLLLRSVPIPVFIGIAGVFAAVEARVAVVLIALGAVAYSSWHRRWERNSEADEALSRAAEHDVDQDQTWEPGRL